jgi:hypothetical protein
MLAPSNPFYATIPTNSSELVPSMRVMIKITPLEVV